jgi:hypothetical protein
VALPATAGVAAQPALHAKLGCRYALATNCSPSAAGQTSALLLKPFGLDVLKAALVDALYARVPFPPTSGRFPAPSG